MASGAITEAAELIRKFMKHLNLRKQNGNGMKIDEQESFFFPSFPFSNLCLVVWYELSKYKLLFIFFSPILSDYCYSLEKLTQNSVHASYTKMA